MRVRLSADDREPAERRAADIRSEDRESPDRTSLPASRARSSDYDGGWVRGGRESSLREDLFDRNTAKPLGNHV